MLNVVFLCIGVAVGFALCWMYMKGKSGKGPDMEEIQALQQEKTGLEQERSRLEQEKNRLELEKAVLQEKVSGGAAELVKLRTDLDGEREKLSLANNRLAKAEEAFKNQNERMSSQKAEFEELQKKFSTEFENIANKLLEEKSKKFVEQNKTSMDTILNPFKERIKEFQDKVDKTYKAESDERVTLKAEIKNLVELNNKISQEANNLATALKGDNKMQGNWGEVILEKILERSGLVKDREYKIQVVTSNAEGVTIKPDVVIYLPDEKHIVVDAKVSLVAYEAYVSADTAEERERFLKEHILSVKAHVKGLSEKNYQTSSLFNTPDFVLLFIPIESSFSLAVQADQDLFSYAWDRKIVIVSPSTLLATLRTISSVWKQESQNRNAFEIARIGGSLYDQFYRFVEDMKGIEKNLTLSQSAYSSAFKRLSEGKGNLISTVEKIKALGAKASKSLDKEIISTADDAEHSIEESKP